MDYKQEMFYRMPERNMAKMPFYMAYPMQNVFLEEMEYERDMQKMKDLYPKEVRAVQALVEEECDKMEYDGSLMFDEYPDKLMLRQIVNRIYDGAVGGQMNIQGFEASPYEAEQYEQEQYEPGQYAAKDKEDDMQAEELPLEGSLVTQGRPPRPGWGPPPPPPHGNNGLQNLIEVLLFNEMYQRRCRHKRCRRWW